MKRVKFKISKIDCNLLLLIISLNTCFGAQDKLLRINTDLTIPGVAAAPSNGIGGHIDAADSTPSVTASLVSDGASHICVREETYVEQLKVPTIQPVRIRSSQWCMEFPPRCSNYKTEMREVMQIKI
ncbi:unnamed protein product [Ceratitis capitata]|uniref:(Mediterranean fruit fly) hypothetical protein n=1 Tax=Ceratitis capitata TaxID=7213 RepID=A0A811UHE8_CERCA|nr:unnamed protein product [Ceratitis capitata]